MTNHGCFGPQANQSIKPLANCKEIGTFCRIYVDSSSSSFPDYWRNNIRQQCLVLARFLYTAVSVWLRLLPSWVSGGLLVAGRGQTAWTGAELVTGEMLGAGVGTGAGTDMGSGTGTGFGTLTGADLGIEGGSGFGISTG